MFTGLIQHVGRVASLEVHPAGRRLVVDPDGWSHRPEAGESISVNGVCLTLVEGGGPTMAFDVVHETLEKTTLGSLEKGSRVNLEHAARADTLMGGHTVQGHIDGQATVAFVKPEGDGVRMGFRLDDPSGEKMRAVVPKGSIAVEGVSLTIAGVSPRERAFEVALIPTTLEWTTLGGTSAGDRVNIETDIIARTISYQLENYFDQLG